MTIRELAAERTGRVKADLEHDTLRYRLMRAEFTLALIRLEAQKGEWGLASLVQELTEPFHFPERKDEA